MLRKFAVLYGAAPAMDRDPATGQFKKPEGETPKPETPPQPTKEEENLVAKLANEFLGSPEPETPPETPPAKPKEPEKKKPAPKAPPKKPAAPAPLTPEAIAAAAAEGATRALAKKPEAETPPAKPAEDDMPEVNKARLPILERMEKLNPAKYKGLATKFKESYPKLKAYQKQWEQEHPGQEFDEDAEEHNEWFEKNTPDWDDDDFMLAQADMLADQRLEEKLKPVNQKLSAYERQQKLEQEMPKISETQFNAAKLIWKHFGDEFTKFFKEDGTLDTAAFTEAVQADPVIQGIRVQTANYLNAEIMELYKVYNGLADFDEKNRLHAAIDEFAASLQNDILAMDKVDQHDNQGREFLTQAEYSAKLRKNKAETEQRYWTLTVKDIAEARAEDLAKKAKLAIEKKEQEFEQFAKARGFKKGGTREESPQPPKPKEEEPPLEEDGKPITPSAGDAPKVAAKDAANSGSSPDVVSSWLERTL